MEPTGAELPTLLTVGHGRLSGDELATLLAGAGVTHLVDVRRFPGSRSNPEVSRDALEETLPGAGVEYRWEERLGGRRRLAPGEPSEDPWWTVEQFRAYAAHTRSDEFRDALRELLREATGESVAVMCSETVWWRCHRRLIADVAVLTGRAHVEHLMHDGSVRPHRPAEGARVSGNNLYWDRNP